MKILKYKKNKQDKYTIYLEDREIILYEDTILKYELLLKKDITEVLLKDIVIYNNMIDVYYEGISYIKKKLRSVYDVEVYLLKKDYPKEYVEFSINKMLELGLLNDRVFTKSFLHKRRTLSNKGPLYIKKELLNMGINNTLIEEVLLEYTEVEQELNINKFIEKSINSNRNKSGVFLKKNIYSNLISLGYTSSSINNILNDYSFDTDNDILKKEEEKIRKRLSRKYKDIELEKQVQLKLRQKGFY